MYLHEQEDILLKNGKIVIPLMSEKILLLMDYAIMVYSKDVQQFLCYKVII